MQVFRRKDTGFGKGLVLPVADDRLLKKTSISGYGWYRRQEIRDRELIKDTGTGSMLPGTESPSGGGPAPADGREHGTCESDGSRWMFFPLAPYFSGRRSR